MGHWNEALPEAMRADPTLKDIPSIEVLAKNYIETKAFVGNAIRPPSDGASPEARKEFLAKLQKHAPELVPFSEDPAAQEMLWAKLGKPESADKYSFKPPEGVDLPLEGLRATALEAGLTQKQFEKLASSAVSTLQKQTQAHKEDNESLRKEWGQAYEAKLLDAAAAANKVGAPKEVVAQIMTGQMNSTQLKLWDSFSKAMGRPEGSDIAKQGASNNSRMTPAEANLQLAEIMANPAYHDRSAPNHKLLVDKYVELMKLVHPG